MRTSSPGANGTPSPRTSGAFMVCPKEPTTPTGSTGSYGGGTGRGLREYDVTPHALRHSCATYLIRAGMPIEMVRVLLNHSSIAVTQRYVKIGLDSVAEWRSRTRALALVSDRAVDLQEYNRHTEP